MKFIPKYYTGGNVGIAATPSLLNAETPSASSTSKPATKKNDADGLISDQVMAKLMKEGIPNDVRNFFSRLDSYEKKASMGIGVNKSELYKLASYANQVIRLADYLKKAESKAYANNALDQVAVNSKGYMYVNSETGLKTVSLSDFDQSKHLALTVGELLEYRKNNDTMVDKDDVATIVGNSIGNELINNFITDMISKIGTTSTSQEAYNSLVSIVGKEGAKRPTEQQLLTLQEMSMLMSKMGPDAIFKLKEKNSSKNVLDAFKYIYDMLPNKMRMQLMANQVAQGASKELAAMHPYNMITQALNMGLSITHEEGIDYDNSINKAAGTQAGTKEKEDKRRMTTSELFFNQALNWQQNGVLISDPKDKNRSGWRAPGNVIPALPHDTNGAVNNAPLDRALDANGHGLGKYLDYNKIWIGNEKDRSYGANLKNIIYTNDLVANVWMPIDSSGNIDWDSLDNFNAAEDYIKLNNITDFREKNMIHQKYGSPVQYDQSGQLDKNLNVALFLMTHGYTIDDTISSDNLMYHELENAEEDIMDDLIKDILKLYKTSISGKNVWDDIIKVPVFIKVTPGSETMAAFYSGRGSQVPDYDIYQDMARELIQQEPPAMLIQGSASSLYQ